MKQILLYLPVFHAGYEALFAKHKDADQVLVVGTSFAEQFPAMAKEIRALSPETAAQVVRTATPVAHARVVEQDDLPDAVVGDVLVVPDEELTRALVVRYGLDKRVEVVFERTFLRWDRSWSLAQKPANYDGVIAGDELSRMMIGKVQLSAGQSSDWWRQVGALIARDGRILDAAYNAHRPSEYTPYINGDPRNDFRRGVRIDLSTAIHAEALLIARAAKEGRSLEGADIFASTFPCPGCARLIAEAGLRRCFFAGPYSVLDGDLVLKSAGVELIWVDSGAESAGAAGLTPQRDGN